MDCKTVRRMLVRKCSWNPATGEKTTIGEEWETRPCGTPLFSAQEVAEGTCKTCLSGWAHPENYPADQGPPTSPENPA